MVVTAQVQAAGVGVTSGVRAIGLRVEFSIC